MRHKKSLWILAALVVFALAFGGAYETQYAHVCRVCGCIKDCDCNGETRLGCIDQGVCVEKMCCDPSGPCSAPC